MIDRQTDGVNWTWAWRVQPLNLVNPGVHAPGAARRAR